ncbi:MAG: hypothetical protein ACXV99_06185, partial [Candidatus Angelobacter sp.]
MPCSTPQYFSYEDQQHANSSALKPKIADRHILIDETTFRRSTSVQNWTFQSCWEMRSRQASSLRIAARRAPHSGHAKSLMDAHI